jgi:hypothetical protein
MPIETIIRDLMEKMDDADWLSDEDRTDLEDMIERFHQESELLEAASKDGAELDPAKLNRWRTGFKAGWFHYFEACQKVADAENELLVKTCESAEAARLLALAKLRQTGECKKMLENGTHQLSWAQIEGIREGIEEVDNALPSLLERITADDILELKKEGVL